MSRIATAVAATALLLSSMPTAQNIDTGTVPILQQSDARRAADIRPADREPRDARHCLEFSGNLEVIACAEKYRYHKTQPVAANG